MGTDKKRLDALEAKVARLTAEVERLTAEPREWHWHSYPSEFVPGPPPGPALTGQPTYGLRMEGTIPEPPLVPVWGRSTGGDGS